jgi:hypothetical protein
MLSLLIPLITELLRHLPPRLQHDESVNMPPTSQTLRIPTRTPLTLHQVRVYTAMSCLPPSPCPGIGRANQPRILAAGTRIPQALGTHLPGHALRPPCASLVPRYASTTTPASTASGRRVFRRVLDDGELLVRCQLKGKEFLVANGEAGCGQSASKLLPLREGPNRLQVEPFIFAFWEEEH